MERIALIVISIAIAAIGFYSLGQGDYLLGLVALGGAALTMSVALEPTRTRR